MPKAYPVYDDGYQAHLAVIRALARRLREPAAGRPQRHAQVQQPGPLDDDGRPGRAQHPGVQYDTWKVNTDDEYHEEGHLQADDFEVNLQELAASQPLVPDTVRRT